MQNNFRRTPLFLQKGMDFERLDWQVAGLQSLPLPDLCTFLAFQRGAGEYGLSIEVRRS